MDFLKNFGEGWAEDAATDEGVEVETVETDDPVDKEPEEVVETEEEPEVEEKPEAEAEKSPHTVPYAEMKREREKRQEAERKLAEAQQQPKPQVQAPKLDAYENPEGFNEHFQTEFQRSQWALRTELDGFRAEQAFGKDEVEAAMKWAEGQISSDPSFGVRVQGSATPVQTVVKEYQQSRTLEALGGKTFEQAAEEYAKSKGWTVSPGEAPQSKPSPKAPTPSLSRRPGQGGSNQNAGDAFEGIFSSDKMGIK